MEQRDAASHQLFNHIRAQVHTKLALLQVLNLSVWLINMSSEQLKWGGMKTSHGRVSRTNLKEEQGLCFLKLFVDVSGTYSSQS